MYGEFNDEIENEMDLDGGRNDEEYIEKLRECDGGWGDQACIQALLENNLIWSDGSGSIWLR